MEERRHDQGHALSPPAEERPYASTGSTPSDFAASTSFS